VRRLFTRLIGSGVSRRTPIRAGIRRSLELDVDLVDVARELEGEFVGEIHG
jgi:hypothetical protein